MSSKLIPEGNSNCSEAASSTEDENSKIHIEFTGDDSGFWEVWMDQREVFLDKYELRTLWNRIGDELAKCTFNED